MTDEMKNVMRGGMWCLIMATLFLACSEAIIDPKTPGSGLTNRDVVIRDTVLFAVSDTSFLTRIATDPLYDVNGAFVLPLQQSSVGKAGNYIARSLMKFFPPIRDTINVLSAKLTLKFLSWRGDSAGTFAFGIHKVNVGWSQDTLKWDAVNGTGFFDPTPLSVYTSTIGPDTQTITINLDTALVRSWYRSDITSSGILLAPTAASSLIRGFAAFDHDSSTYGPKLQVIARGISQGALIDTTTFTTAIDCYVADVSPFNMLTDHLYTQAGVAYRSSLKFDVSSLPRGAIVNTAELLLVSDPAITKISKFTANPQPTVHARTADSSKYQATGSTGTISSGTTYAFDVRLQMQQWVGGYNYGLLLRQPNVNEFGTLDLFGFYSSEAANASVRPRIKVKYAVFQ